MAQQAAYAGTGHRKDSVVRVRLVPDNGQTTINKEDVTKYIPYPNLAQDVKQPLALTETEGQYNAEVNVNGGGFSEQVDAIYLGIVYVFLEVGPNFRGSLKKTGMLARDPRIEEREKPGLKRARKASQFSKR